MKLKITFLLLMLSFFLIGQDRYLPSVKTFTTKDGLSSDKIQVLHKDARGFIWIGTEEGLNRFDGQEFKTYSPDPHSEMTISNIHYIAEDEEGWLWLIKTHENYEKDFTSCEINFLNIYTGEIRSLEEHFGETFPISPNQLSYFEQLDDKSICFLSRVTNKGYFYRTKSGFQPFEYPELIVLSNDLQLQKDGNYLLQGTELMPNVSSHGFWYVYKISPEGEIIKKRRTDLQLTVQDKDKSFNIEFSQTTNVGGGFNAMAYDFFDRELSQQNSSTSAEAIRINQSEWNEEQQLFWLIEQNKIFAIKPNGDIVYQREDQFDSPRVPLLLDGNTAWLSNKKNGLVAINLEPNYFENHRFFDFDLDNSTRGIYTETDGQLWSSTIAGIGKVDLQGNISSKRFDAFTSFLEGKNNTLWYFENRKLIAYNLKSDRYRTIKIDSIHYHFWALYEADNGEIWFRDKKDHLLALNPKTEKIYPISKLPVYNERIELIVYAFVKRDAQTVWLCTNQGLYVVDKDGQYLTSYNSEQKGIAYLPAMDIHHLYKDVNGILWLATGDAGLLKLSENNNEVDKITNGLQVEKQYTIKDGLSSNALHAVYEDDFGYLWISSDHGLMQFDKHNDKVTPYLTENGLPHDEFNRIAHHQGKDGALYFGGLNGLTTFHPKHFANARKQVETAPLVITNFQQYSGEKEQFVDLTTAITTNNTITLQPSDRFFKLQIAMLDYQDNDEITYQYRIPGLHDWQSSKDNELSFSGLPYSNHQLEIKAKNKHQKEAANDLAISIKVLRPFYLQWWFLISTFCALAALAFVIIKRRTHRLLVLQEAEQLKNLDQMKSRFFANISHELRTPLTLIGLPVEHLINNLKDHSDQEIIQKLNSVQSHKNDLAKLVNEILALSKLDANKMQLENKNLTLKPFIARVVSVFHSAAAAKNIDYHFSVFIDEDIKVEVDPLKLEMVLNNLISNALKFTPKDGKIAVSADWNEADELTFKIQDTGRGIHPDDLPSIFERYFQTNQKNAKLEGGSGIGLALCKELTELMGGTLTVSSKWKEGSTFSFKIPLKKGSMVEQSSPVEIFSNGEFLSPSQKRQFIFSKEKPTLLLVEDNHQLRKYLCEMLGDRYNMLTAENGKAALDLLQNSTADTKPTPALILSDVMMPEMDGFTFLKNIKADKQWCHLPFIMLTARADMQNKLEALTIGVDDYITKPFDTEELVLRIKNLLQNVKVRQIEAAVQETEEPKQTSEKIEPVATKKKNPKVSPDDLEWIKLVETIAKKEMRNPNFTIEHFAKATHVSERQFYRRVKLITGLTPNQYVREIKLNIARQILEAGNVYTLTEIIQDIGFENPSYFAKLFEDRFGMRPQEFLQQEKI